MVWKLTAAMSAAALAVRGIRLARQGAYGRGFARGVTVGAAVAALDHATRPTSGFKGETEQ